MQMSIIPQQSQTQNNQKYYFFNDFSNIHLNNLPNNNNNNNNNNNQFQHKRQQSIMIQFPQVSQLRITPQPDQSQMVQMNHNHHKQIHPIRNKFNTNQMKWLIQQYHPKSKILQKLDNLDTFHIKKYKNGVYFGQLNENNQKHGHGAIFYYNGRLYEGQFHNDLKHGKGYQQLSDGSKFQGFYQNGVKQGKGTFQWANGQIYQGQWYNGKKHGSGIWKGQSNQKYIGEWKYNTVEGFGVFISSNGDRYQGEFKNSAKHGYGTERYHYGEIYIGQFKQNRPNGKGQYYWTDGSYYKGEFVNQLRHGHGYYIAKNNKQLYQGQFRNDKKCGLGELIIKNKKYKGNFQNDYQHGYGQLYQEQQLVYSGYWVNGKPLDQTQTPQPQTLPTKTKYRKFSTIVSQRPQQTNQPNNKTKNIVNQMNNDITKKRVNRFKANQTNNKIIIGKNSKMKLSKSRSRQNNSLESIENSPDKSNHKRQCGCSRKH